MLCGEAGEGRARYILCATLGITKSARPLLGEARRHGMVRPKFALAVGSALVLAAGASVSGLPAVAAPGIAFSTPVVVDPIHTNGEPDIGIDPQGRVFVSGPTGTGTHRSSWLGSVDTPQTLRRSSPARPPSAPPGITDPP